MRAIQFSPGYGCHVTSVFEGRATVPIPDSQVDVWDLYAHAEGILSSALTSEDGFRFRCSVKTEHASHRAESISDLRGKIRGQESAKIRLITLSNIQGVVSQGGREVRLYYAPQFGPTSIMITAEGPDEAWVTGWAEKVRREIAYRLPSESVSVAPIQRPAELPSGVRLDALRNDDVRPLEPTASAPDKGFFKDLSVEVLGGLLVVVIVAVAGLAWAAWGR